MDKVGILVGRRPRSLQVVNLPLDVGRDAVGLDGGEIDAEDMCARELVAG